jgi:F0F1-type ATP synthase assembly protein I
LAASGAGVAERDRNGMQQLGKYLGLAFLFPCCALVGYVIGYYLDKAFGTSFMKLLFLLFGIAAGFIEVFRELKPDNDGGH